MSKTIRVGLVGTGKFAGHHAAAWRSLGAVELVGVHGSNSVRTESFATKQACTPFSDVATLAAACDIIDVASANDTHADYALEAIARGRHVVVEKPLDTNLEKARALCVAARDQGIVASVISNYRFNPCFVEMKRMLDQGMLGDIIGGQVSVVCQRADKYYAKNGGWRGDWVRAGGGVLIHQCIHHIDLLHWFFGPVIEAEGYLSDWTGGVEGRGVERTFTGWMAFENVGPVGLFMTTKGESSAMERFEIFGTRSTGVANGRSFCASAREPVRHLAEIMSGFIGRRRKPENAAAQLQRQFREIVAVVLGREGKLSATIDDGLRAIETVSRLYGRDRKIG